MPRKSHPKISPTRVDTSSPFINPTDINPEQRISFNLRRLIEKDEKFIYCTREAKYFISLVERLKGLSDHTKKELVTNNSKSLRFHQIDFTDRSVTENSFGIIGEDIDDDAWQFTLSSNEHGRVHGYFVDEVFYVVWLDPDHQLYASVK